LQPVYRTKHSLARPIVLRYDFLAFFGVATAWNWGGEEKAR